MKTIEVIPRRELHNASTGQTASFYGSCPPGFRPRTNGFTWKVIGWDGSIRIGLCRQPAKTRAEAELIAREYGERFGYRVI